MPTSLLEQRKIHNNRLKAIAGKLREISAGFETKDVGTPNEAIHVDEAAATEFQTLIGEQRGIREQLSEWDDMDSLDDLLAKGDQPATRSVNAGGRPTGPAEYKSVGRRFIESDAFKNRDPAGNTREEFQIDRDLMALGGLERKDLYTASGGTLTNFAFGSVQREPMVPRAYRTARVRDLFPVAGTNSALIEYVRVLGFLNGVNNAAPVAERTSDDSGFALKPQTKLQFAPAQSPLRTLAHWEAAHRNTLSDEPMLQSIIDTELLYGLRLVEDDQILNGDGTGENMLGILRTPGIQIYPDVINPGVPTTDTRIDAIRRGATRVMLAYYEPTGVVVHPFDWERMELTKDSMGNYVMAVNVSVGAQKQVWQMPVVASPAMTEGTALVGAYGLGAKVYDREQANIRIAEQHADFFLRNALVVLAEERVGLTVSRPESFVKIDFGVGSPAQP
jgi:HK97 family phage major capsid protein